MCAKGWARSRRPALLLVAIHLTGLVTPPPTTQEWGAPDHQKVLVTIQTQVLTSFQKDSGTRSQKQGRTWRPGWFARPWGGRGGGSTPPGGRRQARRQQQTIPIERKVHRFRPFQPIDPPPPRGRGGCGVERLKAVRWQPACPSPPSPYCGSGEAHPPSSVSGS